MRRHANNSNMAVCPELCGYPNPSRGTAVFTRLSDSTFGSQELQAEKDASKIVQKCTQPEPTTNSKAPQGELS